MQYTFSRIEQKYILTFEQADMLKSLVACHVPQDEYGPTTICNIYYDTPNSELITKSLEKPIYKEKLRLRSYGIPTLNSTVFVETKKIQRHCI